MKRIIMNMKANPEINNFVQDILFMDEDKGETVISLRNLVLEIAPSAKEAIRGCFAESLSEKIISRWSLIEARSCRTLMIFLKEAEKTDGT
jgi:hypothetical protein